MGRGERGVRRGHGTLAGRFLQPPELQPARPGFVHQRDLRVSRRQAVGRSDPRRRQPLGVLRSGGEAARQRSRRPVQGAHRSRVSRGVRSRRSARTTSIWTTWMSGGSSRAAASDDDVPRPRDAEQSTDTGAIRRIRLGRGGHDDPVKRARPGTGRRFFAYPDGDSTSSGVAETRGSGARHNAAGNAAPTEFGCRGSRRRSGVPNSAPP